MKIIYMDLNSTFGKFRLVAILEGISYLLFAITMPLKYVLDMPEPNYVVGMAHGLLFLAYIALCVFLIMKYKWSFKTSFMALLASLIPFGTFYADAKIFKPFSLRLGEEQ